MSRSEGLVGRDQELARLSSLVSEVVAGHGNTVWVEGEPGIGKTARTVQTHVSHILAKLGARPRVEIAAAASPYLGDSAAGTSPRASGE